MAPRHTRQQEQNDEQHSTKQRKMSMPLLDQQRHSSNHFQRRTSPRLQAAASKRMASPMSSARRFTFGFMADIQYAPIPDGYSYAGVKRYYRHSLEVAHHAARHFQDEQVPLVINLGDIIDGKCQAVTRDRGAEAAIVENDSHESVVKDNDSNSNKMNSNDNNQFDSGLHPIDHVLDALSAYTHGPILHTYGNHELYNLDRTTLGVKLGIPFVQEPCGDLVGYRSYVHDGIRFVVLDTYDIAKLQRCPDTSRKHREACEILKRYNPNYPHAENSPDGMNGLARRYVAFNGAVGPIQLAWLRDVLTKARDHQEKVILLSHQPILPGSSSPVCLVWNYEEVLEVLRDFSDVVIASLAGHAHKGGYKRDPMSGIHFRVIEAVLENPAPHKTYGFIDVHEECLIVRGYGNCTSSMYDFDHLLTKAAQQQQEQDSVTRNRNITAIAVK